MHVVRAYVRNHSLLFNNLIHSNLSFDHVVLTASMLLTGQTFL